MSQPKLSANRELRVFWPLHLSRNVICLLYPLFLFFFRAAVFAISLHSFSTVIASSSAVSTVDTPLLHVPALSILFKAVSSLVCRHQLILLSVDLSTLVMRAISRKDFFLALRRLTASFRFFCSLKSHFQIDLAFVRLFPHMIEFVMISSPRVAVWQRTRLVLQSRPMKISGSCNFSSAPLCFGFQGKHSRSE